jgi:hypothetical protein
MKKLLYKIKAKFLDIFGNIRISKLPPFLFYDDVVYKMNGDRIRDVLKVSKPGDVILRGFDSYLDSMFVPSTRRYSHAGIIVENGKVIHSVSPCVEKIDLIDFMQCDRIAIARPSRNVRNALKTAKEFLRNKTPYDFSFSCGESALYCFELAAYCYPKLNVEKKTASIFHGLIKKSEKVYLSDSFFDSKDFTVVYEYNPKFGIDYISNRH